jgi:hypothetical protein
MDSDSDDYDEGGIKILETTEHTEKYSCVMDDRKFFIIGESKNYNFLKNIILYKLPTFGIQPHVKFMYSFDNVKYELLGIIYANYTCDEDEMSIVSNDIYDKLESIIRYIQNEYPNREQIYHTNTINYDQNRLEMYRFKYTIS